MEDVIKEDVEWVLIGDKSRGFWLRWLPETIILSEQENIRKWHLKKSFGVELITARASTNLGLESQKF